LHRELRALKKRNAWVFADARRQHGPMTIANLVVQEYNMLKSINMGRVIGGVGEHVNRE
jgi:hypothetical protein